MEINEERIIEKGGVDLNQAIRDLENGQMRNLSFDRLCISFGANKDALNMALMLIFFSEAQYNTFKNEMTSKSKHGGYFFRTDYQMMHKTYLSKPSIDKAIKGLKELGIVETTRKDSFKGQLKYRVCFNQVRKYLKSKEDFYYNYLDGYEDRVTSDLEKRREEINKSLENMKLIGNSRTESITETWDDINKLLKHEELTVDDINNLQDLGLSIVEIAVMYTISRSMKDYRNVDTIWNLYLFNNMMKNFSESSIKEIRLATEGKENPRDKQDKFIFSKLTCRALVAAAKETPNYIDNTQTESGNWFEPFRKSFLNVRNLPEYRPCIKKQGAPIEFAKDFLRTNEDYLINIRTFIGE